MAVSERAPGFTPEDGVRILDEIEVLVAQVRAALGAGRFIEARGWMGYLTDTAIEQDVFESGWYMEVPR